VGSTLPGGDRGRLEPAGELQIRQVSHGFNSRGTWYEVLHDINLCISSGEIFCLVGPSGCGKTTLLNIVAGFIEPTEGAVYLDEYAVQRPANDRVVVFQDVHNSLFPWMTVRENVDFGLKMLGLRQKERKFRIASFLELVGLTEHGQKFPDELSGGMKQRVQLARALATDPKVLLMDEPFAALDAQTRRVMQTEFLRILETTKTTALFITHDIFESILLGDRVGVMSRAPEARILRLIPIDLPRPRSLRSPTFAEYVTEVESLLTVELSHGK
jgi:NitT/TauT family transport system ATP-binding protein